ncbi:hypothetical protein HK103_005181 [Boothiomyces macroporosus]|uniref:Uncharacterized protein n=1 Tax=Boothiomyces macroporosus TaxID=261099 RepID=A0AAD5UFJ8_9FUNG|nr:hypothetical protein HK103_005181 [Boothiomyces macroporosus]
MRNYQNFQIDGKESPQSQPENNNGLYIGIIIGGFAFVMESQATLDPMIFAIDPANRVSRASTYNAHNPFLDSVPYDTKMFKDFENQPKVYPGYVDYGQNYETYTDIYNDKIYPADYTQLQDLFDVQNSYDDPKIKHNPFMTTLEKSNLHNPFIIPMRDLNPRISTTTLGMNAKLERNSLPRPNPSQITRQRSLSYPGARVSVVGSEVIEQYCTSERTSPKNSVAIDAEEIIHDIEQELVSFKDLQEPKNDQLQNLNDLLEAIQGIKDSFRDSMEITEYRTIASTRTKSTLSKLNESLRRSQSLGSNQPDSVTSEI